MPSGRVAEEKDGNRVDDGPDASLRPVDDPDAADMVNGNGVGPTPIGVRSGRAFSMLRQLPLLCGRLGRNIAEASLAGVEPPVRVRVEEEEDWRGVAERLRSLIEAVLAALDARRFRATLAVAVEAGAAYSRGECAVEEVLDAEEEVYERLGLGDDEYTPEGSLPRPLANFVSRPLARTSLLWLHAEHERPDIWRNWQCQSLTVLLCYPRGCKCSPLVSQCKIRTVVAGHISFSDSCRSHMRSGPHPLRRACKEGSVRHGYTRAARAA